MSSKKVSSDNIISFKKEDIIKKYNDALYKLSVENNPKNKAFVSVYQDIFGKELFAPVTEKIRTLDDARNFLGNNNLLVKAYNDFMERADYLNTLYTDFYTENLNLTAFYQLRVICAALNEGWKPTFKKGEKIYHPLFTLFSKPPENIHTSDYDGFKYLSVVTYNIHPISPDLCLKTPELAEYCGKQFIYNWANFYLRRY